ERQEIENSLLYKEFNKSKNKRNLENFDKYLIILGAITLAEQKPEDFKHKYWLNNLIQKQLRSGLELKPDYNLNNFKAIQLTPERTEDVKKEINQKLLELKQKYYLEQLKRLYLANQQG
ncbi:7238_t:CDS:1, partial [Dentiscutata erythropus]